MPNGLHDSQWPVSSSSAGTLPSHCQSIASQARDSHDIVVDQRSMYDRDANVCRHITAILYMTFLEGSRKFPVYCPAFERALIA